MCVCVCERERECVCVCVCVREREREREREGREEGRVHHVAFKLDAIADQFVHVRRLHLRVVGWPVPPRVSPTEIIDEQEQNVGLVEASGDSSAPEQHHRKQQHLMFLSV